MSDHFDDSRDTPLQGDDALRRGLDDAVPQPPMDDVDWMTLHARIAAAASPNLAALTAARAADAVRQADAIRGLPSTRQAHSVWQPLARWSPSGIPLAAAATVLLMLGAAWLGTAPAGEVADTGDVAFRTLEEEFVDGLGVSAAPLLAGISADELLDAVLFYGGEDR
ncbi:MAG TPA: hypothetical protein VK929_09845 [Longimicrobiales bacterium]|nr:hypothetical protein [Longimicrobiales bacterium]